MMTAMLSNVTSNHNHDQPHSTSCLTLEYDDKAWAVVYTQPHPMNCPFTFYNDVPATTRAILPYYPGLCVQTSDCKSTDYNSQRPIYGGVTDFGWTSSSMTSQGRRGHREAGSGPQRALLHKPLGVGSNGSGSVVDTVENPPSIQLEKPG